MLYVENCAKNKILFVKFKTMKSMLPIRVGGFLFIVARIKRDCESERNFRQRTPVNKHHAILVMLNETVLSGILIVQRKTK